MKFYKPNSEIYIPDNTPTDKALSRTTHLCIAAHQDDIEIMAYHGILECFGKPDKWFTGVTTTNGAGSPRSGIYANYTDEDMQKIRRTEQKKAAFVGEYSAMIFLDYTSKEIKTPSMREPVEDIKQILLSTKPQILYTHNPADKHDTHVATMLRTLTALRELPKDNLPQKVYGCEVWRSLDWMNDEDKAVFDVSEHDNLAVALVSIFDSQICGGKRYDFATLGRRRANATYYASHGLDTATAMIYAIDLTPLVLDPKLDVIDYTLQFIEKFKNDVKNRIKMLSE
ncbi:MAG: PIG-L family deacetylase [Endomicrobia bacterium]|nr:PIG-L family deacetylase [Endomicrobiia bacterium]MCX7716676.1 PIG-L family deacetylase [Endomicrobiia bacterium]